MSKIQKEADDQVKRVKTGLRNEKDYKLVTKYPQFLFVVLLKISLHSLVTESFVQDKVTYKMVLFVVTTGTSFTGTLHQK